MGASQHTGWLSQVRRGLLELCVLALIGRSSTDGYEIVTRLGENAALAAGEGTIYPLLRRLRRDGLLATSWQESDAGPPRQYYELTTKGADHLDSLKQEWDEIVASVGTTLEPEKANG